MQSALSQKGDREKMKTIKTVLLCALIFLLSLSLFSCGDNNDTVTTEAPSGETDIAKDKLLISKESLSEYTVITPVSAGSRYNDAVSLISQAVSEKYGVTLKLSDDFLMEGDTPSGKEIILGSANRDFVIEELLPCDSYHIYASGESIVINGGSTEAISEAIAHFVTLFEQDGIAMDENGYVKESKYTLAGLKINGKHISEYKIITKGTSYGAKYAAELLREKISEATGWELKITTGKSPTAIYIDSTDTGDGRYYIDVDEKSVTLYGSGMSGAYTAVDALLDIIGENEDVTLESTSAHMFTLENTKKKLSDGSLSIGVLGDSVMAGAGGMKPLCDFFVELLRAEYPNADIKMNNCSIGGKNTMWGLYYFEKALLEKGYSDLLIISLGTNDQPYGAGYDEIALNYQSMIEKARMFNPECEIIFVTYGRNNEVKNVGTGKETTFMKAMLDVAEYYKIPVVDTCQALYNLCADNFNETWSKYVYDSVHANNVGQELYGNILFTAVKEALDNSDGSAPNECYMPTEPLFQNSKKNAVLESWSSFSKEVAYGTGEEAGWRTSGTVSTAGASISFGFEGVGIELGIERNDSNAFFILIQIYDEAGELVFEREWDSGYYYHLFVTNELEYGKYTIKLTATKPSEKYPSNKPTFTLVDRKIIK